jgi:hypothetical protein
MTDHLFEHLLSTNEIDLGCESGFEMIEQYVDAVLRGDDVALKYPGIVAHMQSCPDCREDIAGLVAAVRELEPPSDPR